MRIFKRINIVLLFAIALFVSITTINVSASSNSYSNFGATYTVTQVTDEKDLGYGVKFHRELATLTTNISGISAGVTVGVAAAQQVSILEVEARKDVQLVPYAFLESASWVASTVKDAAAQYEARNPGYRVIAAVNGDFFHINDAVKASTGVTIGQGEYYKAVSNHGAVNTLAIKNSGEGKQLFTTKVNSSVPVLSIYDKDNNIIKKITIDNVNKEPGENEISLYYAQRTQSFGNDVTPVKVSGAYYVKIATCAVTALKNSFYGVGVISQFSDSEVELIKGQFAIKSNNSEINALLAADVKIRCQYEYNDPSLEGVENFIGFPYQIITDSEPWKEVQANVDNAMYRHPRTIIGQKANGEVVLAVVDGRQTTKGMYGATSVEMSAIMAYYDCVDAWNLDGGGSSTMIVRKQEGWDFVGAFEEEKSNWHITNSPSDGGERSDGNHLLVVVKIPEIVMDIHELSENSITLHVALLTDVDKYKELYVLMNGEYYPVKDEYVTVPGLKKNSSYQFKLFTKVDGEYLDLMTVANYKTAKPAPTSVEVQVGIYEKNGIEYILVRYKADKTDAIKTIVIIADKEYMTAGESIMIEKSQAFYDALSNAVIEIKYNTHDMNEDEILKLEDFVISFELKYILEEFNSTVNSIVSDVFN